MSAAIRGSHLAVSISILWLAGVSGLASPQALPQAPPAPTAEAALARERQAEPLYLAAVAAAGKAADADATRVLDAIEAALKAGACPTRTLTEGAFAKLHSTRRFRELIRDHARQSAISMTVPGEVGERLQVRGFVRDQEGRPVAGALVYVFQTDASGHYSEGGMDESNPRIFGYVVTAADGSYSFKTIRPGHYPDEDEPVEQHIHYEVSAKDHAAKTTRLGFADDRFWKGKAIPAWAAPVKKAADGGQLCECDVRLVRSR